jgi:putative phosphoesterase
MQSAAIITDIHGNLPALDAALAAVDQIAPDAVYCGGDTVGYGPWPNEVCRTIEERGIPTIYGNYDYAIAREEEDCEHTDQRSKDYMRGLPFDLRFELGGKRVRLVHGSPRKVNEYLFADKPAKTFERIAAGADCDVLVCGHTHKPWIAEFGGVLFVNCGSVGKPKDGDPRGAFAVLETAGEGVAARIERFEYDVELASREVASAGLPSEFAEKLLVAA